MGVSAAEQEVLGRIDESRLVELTTALVRAAGQNPPGEEAATVEVLCAAAAELGLDVVETAVERGRNNMRITLEGGTGPGLLLLGHTDVVPVGEGWTEDPFGGAVHDGRIYGRGASDMKGGLAAALTALASWADPSSWPPWWTRRKPAKESAPMSSPRGGRSSAASPRSQPTCGPSSVLVVPATCASRSTETPVTQAIPTTARTRYTERPRW
jgi:Peptidase family M20/M25/M40